MVTDGTSNTLLYSEKSVLLLSQSYQPQSGDYPAWNVGDSIIGFFTEIPPNPQRFGPSFLRGALLWIGAESNQYPGGLNCAFARRLGSFHQRNNQRLGASEQPIPSLYLARASQP